MANQKSDKYDNEPVYYCTRCKSLRIIHIKGESIDYCEECGCAEIARTSINEWLKLKRKENKNGRENCSGQSNPGD